jgi:hypothetical protein
MTSHQPTTFTTRQGDQLRIAPLDVVENEIAGRTDRRRLEKRQIPPLFCNEIEGPVKAFDMVFGYRNNVHRAHRLCNVLIPPLAEWPGNNYLGSTPPTTD